MKKGRNVMQTCEDILLNDGLSASQKAINAVAHQMRMAVWNVQALTEYGPSGSTTDIFTREGRPSPLGHDVNKVGVWAEVYIQCRRAIRQLMFERDGRAVGEIEAAMEFEEVTNWRVNTNQQPDTYRLPCKVVQLNDIMNTLFEVVIRARRVKVKR